MSKRSGICTWIPSDIGSEEQSTLFKELYEITKNRELTKTLWGLAQDNMFMQSIGLKQSNNVTASQLIKALGEKASSLFTEENMGNYITIKEGLDEDLFDTYSEAMDYTDGLIYKYDKLVPQVYYEDGSYKIRMVERTEDSIKKYAEDTALHSLNTKIADYMNSLGFDIEERKDLGYEGLFSPRQARQNADGLKTAILLSQGKIGQRALPEEFSHFIVEGFQNHPLMQRLMNAVEENDLAQIILGEEYEKYNRLYKGDDEMLVKEAVGKMIAQNLVNREGINDSIKYVSERTLNVILNNFSYGEADDVDLMLKELQDEVSNIVSDFYQDRLNIELFDADNILKAKDFYKIEKGISQFQDVVYQGYQVLSKRIRLKQVKSKGGKLSKEDRTYFEKLNKAINQDKYALSCTNFLNYAQLDCKKTSEKLLKLKQVFDNKKELSLDNLKKAFKSLRDIETIIAAYKDVVSQMKIMDAQEGSEDLLTEDQMDEIINLATDVDRLLNRLSKTYKEMRLSCVLQLVQKYWSGDRTVKTNDGKEVRIELQSILESFTGDINGFSRLVNSLADMPDPLLQLTDIIMKDTLYQRNNKVFAMQQKIGKIQEEYTKATGSKDMRWMYVFKDGKPTGMFKSDRDYTKFFKDKRDYEAELREKYKSIKESDPEKYYTQIKKDTDNWVRENTEQYTYTVGNIERTIRIPVEEKYYSNDLENMSEAQKKCYNELIEIKKQMDILLPKRNVSAVGSLYRAPQKKVDSQEALLQGRGRAAAKALKDKLNIFSIDADQSDQQQKLSTIKVIGNPDDGQIATDEDGINSTGLDEKEQYVLKDFQGNIVKTVPVYYTAWLGDEMNQLDTNATETMLQYCAMALNYDSMNSISDEMEVLASFYADRPIRQTSDTGQKLFSRFTMKTNKTEKDSFKEDLEMKGSETNMYKKLRNYIDKSLYADRKQDEHFSFKLNDKTVNVYYGKGMDLTKSYSQQIGLGVNLFSGMTNVSMGVAQTLLECCGGQSFNLKEILKAHEQYMAQIGPTILETYEDVKTTKLGLILQRFDPEGDYFYDTDNVAYVSGLIKKGIKKMNPLLFNSLGEHYLHSIALLGVLNHTKVYQKQEDGSFKQISLYDALEVQDVKQGDVVYKKLVVADNIFKEDKQTEFKDKDLFYIKLKVDQVNNRMHGAFSEVDKGDIHRFALGRLIMQYRQWMPAFYMARYRKERYNVIEGDMEAGFYRTFLKFSTHLMEDLIHWKFQVATRWGELSDRQKAEVKKASEEIAVYTSIWATLKWGFANGPDKDDPGLTNMLLYNLYRLRLELGSAVPSIAFAENVATLINTPVPCLNVINNAMDLLNFSDMGETIKSGKYAGWNRYVKTLYFNTPYIRNVNRAIDLLFEGDVQMFNPYIKNAA